MKMQILLILSTLIGASTSIAQTNTITTVLNGKATLILPKGFKPMDKETITIKFPRGNPPMEVFSNKGGKTSIAITVTEETHLSPVLDGHMFDLIKHGAKDQDVNANYYCQLEELTAEGWLKRANEELEEEDLE